MKEWNSGADGAVGGFPGGHTRLRITNLGGEGPVGQEVEGWGGHTRVVGGRRDSDVNETPDYY